MPDVAEFYVDQFHTNMNPYTAVITFGLAAPHPTSSGQQPVEDTVRVRMSLEHMKIMVLILKKNLKAYEEQTQAAVNIPRSVLNQLGLSQEDW